MTEEDFYAWDGELNQQKTFQEAEKRCQLSLSKDEILRDRYFKVLSEVTEASGLPRWEHIDLFAVRETSQKEVIKLLKIQGAGNDEDPSEVFNMSEFAKVQLDIALDAFTLLEPSTIVVISAIASKVLRSYVKQKKLNLEFRKDCGTYMLALGGRRIPLFLSGMLARQHALDVFSRERLGWHIGYAQTFSERGT